MTRRGFVFLLATSTVLAGCAERTMIRSYPSGSKVFVNEQFVGITPLLYRVPASDIEKQFQVRVERPGYSSASGMLQKGSCPGRTVAGIFSFGILYLFRSSQCLADSQDFALSEDDGGDSEPQAGPSVQDRLQRLDDLRRDGTIDDDEHRRYRDAILKGN